MKNILFAIILICTSLLTFAQDLVDVTEQTIKIGAYKEEELYFGFAEGDKIIFNFREINNKDLKEIEIIEYPNNSKFSDFKTSKIENKIFNVRKKSVYIFRIKNSAITGRICKIHIQRIPSSLSTKNFNSTVSWVIKEDTTWNTYTKDIITGYDTTYEQRVKKELIKSEKREELIMDKMQRVHSITNENGNKTYVFFTLPINQQSPYKTKKVISWAYWVGVGEEANQAWKENAKTISTLTKGVASYFVSPLGALALGAVTDLMIPNIGEDVSYAITDQVNKNLFMAGLSYRLFDKGKGIAGYKNFTNINLSQGTYFICLSNDNFRLGIDVNVKAIAIVETNTFIDMPFTETIVKPKYEKKIFKDPLISKNRIPITGL